MKPTQLPLPLPVSSALSRADLIVGPANAEAAAFIDSWPDWPVTSAVLYGPPGCGKSHLASIWRASSGAAVISAAEGSRHALRGPLAVEDVDSTNPTLVRDGALFAALETARPGAPVLLTGRDLPSAWPCALPDLASRFAAIASIALRAPDETMLAALARKLFADRQLAVPDAAIERMLHLLERSPAAIRDFVAHADAAALAQSRPVNLALVRELIAEEEGGSDSAW